MSSDSKPPHVVYTMDAEGHPSHMLAIADTRDKLEATMDKWWNTFHTGEKVTPEGYNGLRHQPSRISNSGSRVMDVSDLVLRDETTDHVPQTRTLTIDLETPWTLHALFRSEAYVSHTTGNALVDIALAANGGYACATIGPTDRIQDRSFDDFFSGGERHLADKT